MRLILPLAVILFALVACEERSQPAASAPAASAAAKPAAAPAKAGGFAVRIDCASEKDRVDASGRAWLSDQVAHAEFKLVGGDSVRREATTVIKGGDLDKDAYLTERYGAMTYHIQAPAGKYDVVLHHCETFDQINAGDRQFTVKVQGKPVLTGFDVFKEAGNKLNTPVAKHIPVTLAAGTIDIEFVEQVQSPEVNAIEVLAAP